VGTIVVRLACTAPLPETHILYCSIGNKLIVDERSWYTFTMLWFPSSYSGVLKAEPETPSTNPQAGTIVVRLACTAPLPEILEAANSRVDPFVFGVPVYSQLRLTECINKMVA